MNVKIEGINYARDRYMEEQGRFAQIEKKCAQIISFLTILIGAFGGIISFKSSTILSPDTPYDWLITGIMSLAAFTLLCAWGHSFRALKISEWPVASKSRENCEYIFSQKEDESLQQIFDCYVDSIEKINTAADEKVTNLEHAYNEIFISVVLISSFIFFVTAGELYK